MKYYVGIDLGGTNIAAGVVDETGKIICKYSRQTNIHQPFEDLVRDIAETGKNVAVDHFDTYTDANGAVRVILLDSDYSSMDGIEVFDTIDLTNLTEVNNVPGGDADEDHLQILRETSQGRIYQVLHPEAY